MNLYQEIIMDHYRNPRHQGVLTPHDFSAEQRNSSCGDEITFTGVIKDNVLTDVAFRGKGCVISQATASILADRVMGMVLDDILSLDNDALLAMLGMQLGPVRMLCALLSLAALQSGIKEYKKR